MHEPEPDRHPRTRRLPTVLRWVPALALALGILRAAGALDPEVALGLRALAFWGALLAWEHAGGRADDAARFVFGLAAGAAFAHLGWLALQPTPAARWPLGQAGYAAAFVTAGPLLAATSCADPEHRRRYLAAALGALPFGLAAARLGCVAAACCDGSRLPAPLAPLLDVAVQFGLGVAASRASALAPPAARVAAIGAANLLNQAIRAPSPATLAPLAGLALGLTALSWRMTRRAPLPRASR